MAGTIANLFRRMYDFVLRWADTPYGRSALFVLALSPVWLTRLRTESPPRIALKMALLFSCLAAVIIGIGFFAYRNFELHHRSDVAHQLSAIAELKVNQLTEYRRERLEDAKLLSNNTSIAALVRRPLKNPEDTGNTRQLQEWLKKLQAHAQYDSGPDDRIKIHQEIELSHKMGGIGRDN